MNFLWDLTALVIGTIGILVLTCLFVFVVVGLPNLICEAVVDRLER